MTKNATRARATRQISTQLLCVKCGLRNFRVGLDEVVGEEADARCRHRENQCRTAEIDAFRKNIAFWELDVARILRGEKRVVDEKTNEVIDRRL